ncbi:four-carbon acid sugar kinase family protein [Halomarina pelagica]|uniref:four-carbon acid sugar kinase family protein n=1 Tax=Halomarina pelagica TaxID=2961599 RepID=UPI0020C3C43C|nr:four-carbon acid sugar kinase family protein [Halomarina sp. BND7]
MQTYQGLVVADDLTGAMDTGHEFARRGYATTVTVREAFDPDGTDVLVVNTDSRYRSRTDAREAVSAALETRRGHVVYKKVDSTLRGNLAAEIEAALRATDADLAVVAPAFPANGRTTACGYHLVDGALVTETAAGRDADKPVSSPHVPTLLADCGTPVRHLGVDTVAAGASAIAEALDAIDAPGVVVCDAVHDVHLDAVARGVADSSRSAVYVGSAGLAGAVDLPGAGTNPSPVDPAGDREVLGVVGSASPTTLEQVNALSGESLVPLDLERAVEDSAAAAVAAGERCAESLASRGIAVVASVLSAGDVDRALDYGAERGVDDREVRDRVAEALARTATDVWTRRPPGGLFVTGGAVAIETVDALGGRGVRLTGREVEPGIPFGTVSGGRADGTALVTKAGAFGSAGTIAACLSALRGSADVPRRR